MRLLLPGLITAALAFTALDAGAQTNAAPVPETGSPECAARPDCRWIGEIVVRTERGAQTLQANRDMEFMVNGRLLLMPGEMVIVTLTDDGSGTKATVIRKGTPAPISAESARNMISQMGPEALDTAQPVDIPPDMQGWRVPDGGLRFSFQQMAGMDDMILVVENGYDRAIDYTAGMRTLDGRRTATTVCTLMPGVTSFEHWPHPIITIDLGAFKFAAKPLGEIVCD